MLKDFSEKKMTEGLKESSECVVGGYLTAIEQKRVFVKYEWSLDLVLPDELHLF